MEPNNVENVLDVKNNLGDGPKNIENGVDVENDFGDCPNNVENGLDVKNILCDCDWKPKLWHVFYNVYEKRISFIVRKYYVNKNKIGDLTSRLFICNKEGFRVVDKGDSLTKNHRQ